MTTKTELIKLLKDNNTKAIGHFTNDDEFNLAEGTVFPIILKDNKPHLHIVKHHEMQAIQLLLDGLGELGGGSPSSQLARILNFGYTYNPEEIRDHILNLDKIMIRMGHIPQ